jgi:formiminotetrahydrofolate cyclodeaminase
MTASLSSLRFVDLLASFRSPNPTPGGGSASAVAGAVGASLLAMVAALPKPRATTADDQKRLADAGSRCAHLSERLASLIDRDSDAYDEVVSAFRLPKASDDEKRMRTAQIQEALRSATEVPLEIMRASAEAIHVAADVAAFGNGNASSDVQVGLELLMAALRGAKLNVAINLTSLKDAAYVEAAGQEAERVDLAAEAARRAAVESLPSQQRS